jgi:hypothetical protein
LGHPAGTKDVAIPELRGSSHSAGWLLEWGRRVEQPDHWIEGQRYFGLGPVRLTVIDDQGRTPDQMHRLQASASTRSLADWD